MWLSVGEHILCNTKLRTWKGYGENVDGSSKITSNDQGLDAHVSAKGQYSLLYRSKRRLGIIWFSNLTVTGIIEQHIYCTDDREKRIW